MIDNCNKCRYFKRPSGTGREAWPIGLRPPIDCDPDHFGVCLVAVDPGDDIVFGGAWVSRSRLACDRFVSLTSPEETMSGNCYRLEVSREPTPRAVATFSEGELASVRDDRLDDMAGAIVLMTRAGPVCLNWPEVEVRRDVLVVPLSPGTTVTLTVMEDD